MRGDAGAAAIGVVEALAGQPAIGAKLARHARQEPGGADVRKKADADFRHRELEAIAGDAVRAVHRHADAAAHDQPVDQRHIGLAIVLNRRVERIFVAPELQRLGVAAGLAQIVKRADIAAGGKGAIAGRGDDNTRDRLVIGPGVELRAQSAHHVVGDGVERLRPVERDQPRRAATFEQDAGVHCIFRSFPRKRESSATS